MSLPCFFSTAGTQVAFCRAKRLFILTPPLFDGTDGVERGEATACFFCSKVTAGVTFSSQTLSAKSRYLPARWFTHLAWLSLSGSGPSGGGWGGGVWREGRGQPWRIRVARGCTSFGIHSKSLLLGAGYLLSLSSLKVIFDWKVFFAANPNPSLSTEATPQHCWQSAYLPPYPKSDEKINTNFICAYSTEKDLRGLAERLEARGNFSLCQTWGVVLPLDLPFCILVTHENIFPHDVIGHLLTHRRC